MQKSTDTGAAWMQKSTEMLAGLMAEARKQEVQEILEEERQSQASRTILTPRMEQEEAERRRKLRERILSVTHVEKVSEENARWRKLAFHLLREGSKDKKAPIRGEGGIRKFDDFQEPQTEEEERVLNAIASALAPSPSWRRPVRAKKSKRRR